MIGMTISFRWPCTYLQISVPDQIVDQKVRRRWYACFRFESFKMYYVAPLTNSDHNFDVTIKAEPPYLKNAWTILSPSGLMASSGMRRKSSLERYPFCCLSSDVNRDHSRSIWLAVTEQEEEENVNTVCIICKCFKPWFHGWFVLINVNWVQDKT